MEIRQADAFVSQTVQIGRARMTVAIRLKIIKPPHIIRQEDQYVGTLSGLQGRRERRGEKEYG
jgi:hypothetical protein